MITKINVKTCYNYIFPIFPIFPIYFSLNLVMLVRVSLVFSSMPNKMKKSDFMPNKTKKPEMK